MIRTKHLTGIATPSKKGKRPFVEFWYLMLIERRGQNFSMGIISSGQELGGVRNGDISRLVEICQALGGY
jgi:hypothetical protein